MASITREEENRVKSRTICKNTMSSSSMLRTISKVAAGNGAFFRSTKMWPSQRVKYKEKGGEKGGLTLSGAVLLKISARVWHYRLISKYCKCWGGEYCSKPSIVLLERTLKYAIGNTKEPEVLHRVWKNRALSRLEHVRKWKFELEHARAFKILHDRAFAWVFDWKCTIFAKIYLFSKAIASGIKKSSIEHARAS